MINYLHQDNEHITGVPLLWQTLANSTVLITGSGGLIGSAIVRALTALNEKYNLNINIIAHTRKTHGDICQPLQITEHADYIFHCAAITSSANMVSKPLEVIKTSIDGTRNVLELARIYGCKSVVNLSSMEVYGQIDGEITEDMLGFVDLSNPRSCYPESKRLGELLCNLYHYQFKVPVKIARLAQTFGAGTPKTDTRVFAQFAKSVQNKTDIILHTEGKSRGNYCYIADTVTALFTLLLKGENGQAYNVSNPETCMTIRDMAELLADKYGVNIIIDIPPDTVKLGYAPETGYKLDIDKISKLGWKPKYGLIDCYERMLSEWGEI
ncbi:NAD-dependent epimerase/dehydratase family protein [Anaerocolumna sp. MB42-C2]|uniref:NAD-dependent epimerase/dehydratase family protein n=1 Tax=Anaerocolumna sp. MB42-C2 TaxID=3070997 RepID=UPI0027E0ABD1|nr:NAD(P)-dependent oxidoreductase [Anaerocolumna sp. MB42-C2]WMJ90196.1 NAD(P)-dependent oxidoreductase [Anaerocolumna sp. MB42-C2]